MGRFKRQEAALLDDSMRRVTYGGTKAKNNRRGRHLSVRQLVVIEMGNNIESVVFYLGCLFKGTVAILVHENLSEFELSEYIEKISARIFIFVNLTSRFQLCMTKLKQRQG